MRAGDGGFCPVPIRDTEPGKAPGPPELLSVPRCFLCRGLTRFLRGLRASRGHRGDGDRARVLGWGKGWGRGWGRGSG